MDIKTSSPNLNDESSKSFDVISCYEDYVDLCNRWGMNENYITHKVWAQFQGSEEICGSLGKLTFTDFDGIIWIADVTESAEDTVAWFRMLNKVRDKFPNAKNSGLTSILKEMKEKYSKNSPDAHFESVDTGNTTIDECPETVWFFIHLYGETRTRKVVETLKIIDPNTSLFSIHALFERWSEFEEYPISWALSLLKAEQGLNQDEAVM